MVHKEYLNGRLVEHTIDGIQQPLIEAPSLFKKTANVMRSLLAAAKNPVKVSPEEKARRLAICEGCEFHDKAKDRCLKCGCFLKWKTALETWHCPIGKW